jgi:hypothetical protein
MPAWVDKRGQIYRAPWRTMDGQVYPITVIPPTQGVRWTDGPPSMTAESTWKMIAVYVGPDAPCPVPKSRQWIFEQAARMTVDQWQRIASAEAAQGIHLKDPKSVAQHIWNRVYAFRPYHLA